MPRPADGPDQDLTHEFLDRLGVPKFNTTDGDRVEMSVLGRVSTLYYAVANNQPLAAALRVALQGMPNRE